MGRMCNQHHQKHQSGLLSIWGFHWKYRYKSSGHRNIQDKLQDCHTPEWLLFEQLHGGKSKYNKVITLDGERESQQLLPWCGITSSSNAEMYDHHAMVCMCSACKQVHALLRDSVVQQEDWHAIDEGEFFCGMRSYHTVYRFTGYTSYSCMRIRIAGRRDLIGYILSSCTTEINCVVE